MVRIRGDLDDRLTGFVHRSIQGPLEEFCANYACAGIKENPSASKKARGNHYGEFYIDERGNTVSIPVRQFIWAATKDFVDGNVGFTAKEIRDILTKTINTNPRVQKQEWSSRGSGLYYRQTTQRALPVLKGDNFNGVFEKLADKMQERLVAAIENVDIVGSDKPRVGGTTKIMRASSKYGQVEGDIRSNAPSTIYHKGFDHPLVDTEEMLNAIEGWTSGDNKD